MIKSIFLSLHLLSFFHTRGSCNQILFFFPPCSLSTLPAMCALHWFQSSPQEACGRVALVTCFTCPLHLHSSQQHVFHIEVISIYRLQCVDTSESRAPRYVPEPNFIVKLFFFIHSFNRYFVRMPTVAKLLLFFFRVCVYAFYDPQCVHKYFKWLDASFWHFFPLIP